MDIAKNQSIHPSAHPFISLSITVQAGKSLKCSLYSIVIHLINQDIFSAGNINV
jgi:hypothetical protein